MSARGADGCGSAPSPRRRSATSAKSASTSATSPKNRAALMMSPERSCRSPSTYHWRRWWSRTFFGHLGGPLHQLSVHRCRSPRSASAPAATIRPSAISAGPGEPSRSSSHSSSTTVVALQRPVAVGQHGVVVQRAVELAGDLQLRCGLAPLAECGTAPDRRSRDAKAMSGRSRSTGCTIRRASS